MQEFPVQRTHDVENQLAELRGQAAKVITESEGLKITDIAKLLGISVDMAKVVVKPMVGNEFRIDGIKRGAKYHLNH